MATKAELEAQIEALQADLRKKSEPEALEPPSPVERGQMYVESHPTLGVLRKAHVTAQSIGDGRPGDGATVVRS